MAIYTTMDKVHQSRTIKPIYARTQATPQDVTLDSAWTNAKDIFPGSVLTRLDGNKVTLCDGTKTPAGLCGTWVAPAFGIDEITGKGGPAKMTMWVLNADSLMSVQLPAYDSAANWTTAKTDLAAGKKIFLKSNADGKLTLDLTGAEGSQTANTATVNSICRLIDLDGTNKIIVAGL